MRKGSDYGPPMLLHRGVLVTTFAFLCFPAFAVEQDEPAPQPQNPPLSKEEIATSVKADSISIPTPGELMAALHKQGKLDWAAQFRPPIATNFTSRPQMALNLGGLIADGYIAVEAENSQQVKNIGKDIVSLARPLGVQQDILNRGKSLSDFAEQNKWDVLKEELEATQNEVKIAMADNKDQDLITLVTVGGWVRGTEVISGYIAQHYTDAGAKLLRQPAIVSFLTAQLSAMPDKMRDDPVVRKTRATLKEIEVAVSFPRDATPTVEDVKRLNTLAADLVKEISRKPTK